MDVLLASAREQVLAEVDGEVVGVGQVGSHVGGEEDVDLLLGEELGSEGSRRDFDLGYVGRLH